MQSFEETLSLSKMCEKHQVPVFLVRQTLLLSPQFPALFCLKIKIHQNVEKVCSTWKLSRKIPGTAKLEIFVKSDVKTILDVPVQ
jgi:hypothetical protein